MATHSKPSAHPLQSSFGPPVDGCALHWLGAVPPCRWAQQLRELQRAIADSPLPVLVVSQSLAGGHYPFVLDATGPALHLAEQPSSGVGLLACEQLALSLSTAARRVVVARTLQLHGPGLVDPAGILRRILRAFDRHKTIDEAVFSLIRTDVAHMQIRQLAEAIAAEHPLAGVQMVGPARSVRTSDIVPALAALLGRPGPPVSGRSPVQRTEVAPTGPAPPLQLELHPTLVALGLHPAEPEPAPTRAVPAIHPRLAPNPQLATRAFDVLSRRQLSNQGPNARRFEERIAQRTGAGHVIAVGSGSAALLLATRALGVQGAAVLPAFTFLATASAVVHAGLTPIFCDIDPHTWTLDTGHLARIVQERSDVGLVLPVTTFGVAPDLTAIEDIAARAGARVLHDACHAFGSKLHGQSVLGRPGLHTLSLHATKVLSAIEGGLVCTHDAALAREVRQLANYGFPPGSRRNALPAFNFHFDELRAEVGHFSLDHADHLLAQRAAIARRYRAAAARFRPQHVPPHSLSGFQEVGVCFPQADQSGIDAVLARLQVLGVQGRRYFHPPLHEIDALGTAHLPVTDQVARQVLCLPVHPHMPEADIATVVHALEAL